MYTPPSPGGYSPLDPDPNAGINAAKKKLAALANKPGTLTPSEQSEYDRLQSYVSGVPSSSSSFGAKDIFAGQKGLLDTANSFTERQMGLSNKYRGIEGAWQSQIDEQANRRINTDGAVKLSLQTNQGGIDKGLQDNQANLSEKAKQNDARRALVNFRSDGQGAG